MTIVYLPATRKTRWSRNV